MRVILIGGSKTVYFLARQFVQRRYNVSIINRDVVRGRELANNTKATVILGEGTDITRLEEAGARQADILLALTSQDQDNLIACQIAQTKFGIPRTIALVNDPDNEEIFKLLGVPVAFSATRIIATIIEQETDFSEITNMMPLAQGRINIIDIHLEATSPAIGKTLSQLELTDNSLIACIIRNQAMIVPRGATRLELDDHILLITDPTHQKENLCVLTGHGEP